MLLAIDIGNSSITTGIFAGNSLLGRHGIPTPPPENLASCLAEIKAFLSENRIEKPLDGVIISSVVPELTDLLAAASREMSAREPLTVSHLLNTGLTFEVERPEEIGADRICNAAAALATAGSPAAAVDFGTATTITAVRDRRFIGGAILPGLKLMSRALHMGTAKLPQMDLAGEKAGAAPFVTALGKSTTHCIISGMIYGSAGAVERIIRGIETEEGCGFKVVVTGGHAPVVAGYMGRECILDPDLTLKGLRLIYERNS